MRKVLTALAGCAIAGAMFASSAAQADMVSRGEARLAKMLDGRVAGEPQSCIFAPNQSQLTVIDRTALVYKKGGTLYVNRPANPRDVSSNDVLVIDRLGHQLCSTDMVTLRSQGSPGFFKGALFLGEFVPYKKAG